MGANSKIEWTSHTFNPWWGCTRVSPGCAHCYAETLAHRYGQDVWGKGKARRMASEKVWAEPIKWNAAAIKAGERHRVFCASMADVFDAEAPAGARERLWALIRATPALDWLLLTKRPENIPDMLPPDWGRGYANVWLGFSAENQAMLDKRIQEADKVEAAIWFISYEPALGPLDFHPAQLAGIDWVIFGGESGPGARPALASWARDVRDQCAA